MQACSRKKLFLRSRSHLKYTNVWKSFFNVFVWSVTLYHSQSWRFKSSGTEENTGFCVSGVAQECLKLGALKKSRFRGSKVKSDPFLTKSD